MTYQPLLKTKSKNTLYNTEIIQFILLTLMINIKATSISKVYVICNTSMTQ